MESAGEVDFAVEVGLFNVGAEVINIWELVGILQGEVVEAAEVSTRPLRAIWLALEVEC